MWHDIRFCEFPALEAVTLPASMIELYSRPEDVAAPALREFSWSFRLEGVAYGGLGRDGDATVHPPGWQVFRGPQERWLRGLVRAKEEVVRENRDAVPLRRITILGHRQANVDAWVSGHGGSPTEEERRAAGGDEGRLRRQPWERIARLWDGFMREAWVELACDELEEALLGGDAAAFRWGRHFMVES
jgi:hypothetical protein